MGEQADSREGSDPRFAMPDTAKPIAPAGLAPVGTAPTGSAPAGSAPAGIGQSSAPTTPREAWRSDELLGDRAEVLILHNNEVYRLRRTRQGKLILHK